ncbi:MAG TPA: DUF1972 domain-containing protein [Prolixibacteraceae bacterium]|jgi:glycosyltransferase involved in cell wall biosynthesis
MKGSIKKLRVHIIGIHGVPAKYGGFETLADFLCQYLRNEYEITVYCNSNKYPEKTKEYFGAKLIYLKLDASGFKGIIYDFITFINALLKADIILYLSPVSSGFMTPLKYLTGKKVIVNHGGLNEWEREKLNYIQRKWAKFNHRVAAYCADANIADNSLYKKSLKAAFHADSIVIKYGGDHVQKVSVDDEILSKKYAFVKEPYAVSVSRAQLDNNIHLVLKAFEYFNNYRIVLVSNWNVSKYGIDLKQKYSNHSNMILLDAIYNQRELDYIRGNAYIYIHSHSRCGTSPSLVEAMCLNQAILSYDVPANRETTKGNAFYFQDAHSLQNLLMSISERQIADSKLKLFSIAMQEYKWQVISQQYRLLINKYKKTTDESSSHLFLNKKSPEHKMLGDFE